MIPIQEIDIKTKMGKFIRVVIEKNPLFRVYGHVIAADKEILPFNSGKPQEAAAPLLAEYLRKISTFLGKDADQIADINFTCNDEFKVFTEVESYIAELGTEINLRMNSEP